MQKTENLDLWFAGQITYLDLTKEEQKYIDSQCDDDFDPEDPKYKD